MKSLNTILILSVSLWTAACNNSASSVENAPIFSDAFDSGTNWTIHDSSTTSGGATGTGGGSVASGKMVLTGNGAVGAPPGSGPCGVGEANLTSGSVTLAPSTAYIARVSYKGLPTGSAPSGNTIVVNGSTFSLVSSTDKTDDFVFATGGSAVALDITLKSYSCDDMGMVLSSELTVYDLQIIPQ